MIKVTKDETFYVVLDTWTESERGWGQRPDGCSLHLTIEDYNLFLEDYWADMPDSAPDEYSRPDGNLKIVKVSSEIYGRVKETLNGIFVWEREFNKLKESKDIDYGK